MREQETLSPLTSTLTKNAPVTPLTSTLTKTKDLKSFNINTYKKRGTPTPFFASTCGVVPTRTLEPAMSETRFARHTSNPIGKRVPGKRGWL